MPTSTKEDEQTEHTPEKIQNIQQEENYYKIIMASWNAVVGEEKEVTFYITTLVITGNIEHDLQSSYIASCMQKLSACLIVISGLKS